MIWERMFQRWMTLDDSETPLGSTFLFYCCFLVMCVITCSVLQARDSYPLSIKVACYDRPARTVSKGGYSRVPDACRV